jgi:LysR family glycine cleavage system transcriptional activator
MPRKLPPLSALRAFEAAARHESFSKAAAELGVTHSAISHQIKALEEHLGRRLFIRTGKQVRPTDAAAACARHLSAHFDGIAASFESILEAPVGQTLNLAVETDMADLWLVSRLPDFEARHPDITVNLKTTENLKGLPNDADCALVWDPVMSNEWQRQTLFENAVFPAAAPHLLAQRPVHAPEDLMAHRFIHDRSRVWFERLLIALNLEPRGMRDDDPLYSRSSLVLSAAAAGRGVVAVDELTARSYLESGRLEVVLAIRLPTELSAQVLYHESESDNPRVRAFLDWLEEQGREHAAWYARFWAARG